MQSIDRLQRFAELGADVLFPVRLGYDAVIEQSGRLPRPLYCGEGRNIAPPPDLEAAGVKFVMDNDVFQISAKVVQELLIELRREGFIARAEGRALSWDEFHEVMGTPEVTRQAVKYGLL
jgi:2-methylisocitrate lyase-like PEP mutase family enzyme